METIWKARCLSLAKASRWTCRILAGVWSNLLVMRLPKTSLEVSPLACYTVHLPIWSGLPLSSVSSCPLGVGASLQINKWTGDWGRETQPCVQKVLHNMQTLSTSGRRKHCRFTPGQYWRTTLMENLQGAELQAAQLVVHFAWKERGTKVCMPTVYGPRPYDSNYLSDKRLKKGSVSSN